MNFFTKTTHTMHYIFTNILIKSKHTLKREKIDANLYIGTLLKIEHGNSTLMCPIFLLLSKLQLV